MRDLFQVVFELKKKEIELARQHIQSKTIHEHQPVTLSVKSSILDSSSPPSNKISREPSTSKTLHKEVKRHFFHHFNQTNYSLCPILDVTRISG